MSPPRPFAAVLYTLTILAACGHGTAGAAADTTDDRADGRVPQQDAPSEQPARIREKGGQQQKAREAEEKADALADGDACELPERIGS